ncbi:hypothetical protein [Sutcliffiella halmapala]|uniref:hypothetical protein n=1 Tax=Sutcliffiella halmapala TaxID=79882 RepID=UPI000994EEEA|nr:hypothetical protein [Sutcliffiella halmapala]
MKIRFVLLLAIFVSVTAIIGCNTKESIPGKAATPPSLLPVSGDYTFQRYIEDKEHTEYRVLYSQVPESKLVQVKLVQELDTTDIAESNNFYEELEDGIYGYIVLSEDFPKDWSAKDIKAFPKTKIIGYPLEVGNEWTEKLSDLDVDITYHIRSINTSVETPAKTFNDAVVIDFEEKDKDGTILRTGSSTFAPQIGWVRHESTDEYLMDVHELVKINE